MACIAFTSLLVQLTLASCECVCARVSERHCCCSSSGVRSSYGRTCCLLFILANSAGYRFCWIAARFLQPRSFQRFSLLSIVRVWSSPSCVVRCVRGAVGTTQPMVGVRLIQNHIQARRLGLAHAHTQLLTHLFTRSSTRTHSA